MAVAELPDWVIGVNIEMQTLAAVAIDIVAQTIGNISIDIAAQTLPTLAVDITAQTLGTVAIDIVAQTLGTVNIDVTSQTVDLNIRTSGGVNIIIDQLTQTAITPRRVTLSNEGVASAWSAETGDDRKGKFFPRGTRGFLRIIEAYCRDDGVVGGTLTIHLAPFIGAGVLYTANIVIPPGGGAATRIAAFNLMWEYDSMFIWFSSSTADMEVAFDVGTPYDGYTSINAGLNWVQENTRYHLRAVMKGLTVGDIPVSGTINVINIPNSAGSPVFFSGNIADNLQHVLDTVYGMGYCDFVRLGVDAAVDSDEFAFSVYCDGVQAWYMQPAHCNVWGHTPATPGLSLLTYADEGACCMLLTTRFEFRQTFEIRGQRKAGGGNIDVYVYGVVNLVR